jgi:CubicO group peptidase (beta-lactamase class C family)
MIVHRGKVVHNQVYGTADAAQKLPLTKEAIWRIASQTKLVTTIAVMMLYEEGQFLLEDPISQYIPAFDSAQVLVWHDSATLAYETRPAARAITIRDLLTHTSGIAYEHPLQDHLEFQMPFYASLDDDLLEEVVDRIASRPLLHDPGAQFTYGLSTDVLGRLVEVVSGQSLAAFFQQHIFAPLRMNDTYFYLPKDKEKRLVTLFKKDQADAPLAVQQDPLLQNFARQGEQTFYSGGAGLVSTAADYAKIGQLILNEGVYQGTRLLSPFTVRLMTRNQIGDYAVWDRHDKFGFGLQIITPDSRYGDLAPPGALTWGGMYCSEYTIDPANELVMQIYTNVYPFAHYRELVRTYRVLVYGALTEGVD